MIEGLAEAVERARTELAAKNAAREEALTLSRDVVRLSANSIRAIHRHEFDQAEQLQARARELLDRVRGALTHHADIYWAGFAQDAQKEYAEACATLALVSGHPLPGPDALLVGVAAYLNGVAESVGELRRHLLDYLRRGEVERCEPLLDAMDEIYGVLVTIDYPDAMTGGLRRTTDSVRGILEKTRGDLTVAMRQEQLERRLAAFASGLAGGGLDAVPSAPAPLRATFADPE